MDRLATALRVAAFVEARDLVQPPTRDQGLGVDAEPVDLGDQGALKLDVVGLTVSFATERALVPAVSDVSFKVVREVQGNKVETSYKGTVSGSDLKLTVTNARGSNDVTFKKQ